MTKSDFPELIIQIKKINRLRWLFISVFVLIVWLSLKESATIITLVTPLSLVLILLLFFDWLYQQLVQGKYQYLGNRTIRTLLFGHVMVDIGLISFGTCITGGEYSLLPLIYVLYFGVLEIFFSPFVFVESHKLVPPAL